MWWYCCFVVSWWTSTPSPLLCAGVRVGTTRRAVHVVAVVPQHVVVLVMLVLVLFVSAAFWCDASDSGIVEARSLLCCCHFLWFAQPQQGCLLLVLL